MSNPPPPGSPERNALLLDFPARLYTAMRTMRLYPASNPQVQRSNEFVTQALQALLASEGAESVTIALLERRLLVCGEQLPDRDQARPQIQGLITLMQRLKMHSLSFHSTFSPSNCVAFIRILADLAGERELEEPVAAILERAGIDSVSVDTKRYVAISEGEQVVREEMLMPGLSVSDQDMVNYVQGKGMPGGGFASLSLDLAKEFGNQLAAAKGGKEVADPADLTRAVRGVLDAIDKQASTSKQAEDVRMLAYTLVDLDPTLLAGVIADLPASQAADELLDAILRHTPPQKLDALIAALSAQGAAAGAEQILEKVRFLSRLVSLEEGKPAQTPSAGAHDADAHRLLLDPETRLAALPDQVLSRLRDPNWSAPMIASAAQQAANPAMQQAGAVDLEAFNRLLAQYEQLLGRDQQAQVARQAGAQLASMDGLALGNILAQKFKGLFGEQLYEQVISQVSDELLDETVEHLTPKQLNRMVATLISDIPLQIGKDRDPDFKPADDSVLKRLAQTKKAPEVNRAIAQNVDARTLLLNPATTLAELPEHLLSRLRDPNWSAPVIASAAQQVADPQGGQGGAIDFAAFNHMLAQYEQLLGREQQTQVARQAGAEMASMDGLALGNILAQKFKGLFGEQLYAQVISQVSDELLDETVEHLTPKQLNRMVATLISDIPLQIGKDQDPDFKPADDSVLKRLAQTKKAPEINRAIAQNVDARTLLLNPATTLAELPEQLLQRLRDPHWSAPVIASAAQQVANPAMQQAGGVSFEAFNRLLAQYEELLGRDQQAQVARQVGAEMASMEGLELGNILTQKFRGLFGEQLYQHILTQVSDELLDETVEHLTPKQLNRMVATLISDIPLQIGKDQDPAFKPADDSVLKRLAQTRKAPEVNRAIAQNIDARRLLLNPETRLAELPDHLLSRLRDPSWSAPVIASAAQQVVDQDVQQDGAVSVEAFNRLLAQYEQLLGREQQTVVARQAGAELASMEGLALGKLLSQKFKGLFGEQLYQQVLSQVSDELLDQTVEHLTPKQLNRMIATLTCDIPLQVGKEQSADFVPADDSVLKRLARTRKAPEVNRAIAQNVDARRLLLNPGTTLAELPEHLLRRLADPAWSVPVIASAAQQVTDPQMQQAGGVDFEDFNRLLAQYEALLGREQQAQVARQAGAELASLEGLALGKILAQKFRGLFGEQLYQQVLSQVSDELLDQTIDHLTPKQLNRMVATLTCDIPLKVGRDKDMEFTPADDSVLKRLARTKKGPQLTKIIAQHIDAHALQAPLEQLQDLPQRLQMRLQQPAWSAPVLVTAAQQAASSADARGGKADFSAFDRLLERYDSLLNREKQLQVATQAGADLANLEEQELGLVLVRKYKNLFGEQLYQQVIAHLSDEQFEKLARRLKAVTEGREALPVDIQDHEAEEAYNRLMRTVRGEKMRTIIEMHREQKRRREERHQETIKTAVDNILQGRIEELEKSAINQELPDVVRNLLNEGKETEADSLLMHLAVGLQHKNPVVRANAAQTLAATAEQLAATGQWQRLTRLLPALEQGLSMPGISEQAIRQTVQAIGSLGGHHLSQQQYDRAHEVVNFLQRIAARAPQQAGNSQQIEEAIADALKQLSSLPMLEHLLDRYLHSEAHREVAGKLLAELGAHSAQFQLQQLMSNESSFERRRLLELIKQTGNPALSILLQQLNRDSPWYVIRNIVRLLGEMGNPDLFPQMRSFISHPDIRVQREVINTAVRIGGEDTRDFLLHALQHVPDPLKVKVVTHVAGAHDERFVRPLTDLLESTKPFQGKNRGDLQIAICKTLGVIGSKRATTSLGRVAESKNILGLGGYPDEVRQAAALALAQIREKAGAQPEAEAAGGNEPVDGGAVPAPSSPPQPAATGPLTEEEEIFHLAAQGHREQAKQRLVELIGAVARAGDFREAERLRERIYEIDPMALAEIIRTGEVIEQEKKGAIPEEDLGIWSRLTDRLSSEEFQTIYHEFSERRFKPEETIVSQGDRNDELFFINQGSVKVSHMTGPRELFITTLSRGQIAGENFFTPSVWTVSLTSLTPSRIYVLQQSTLSAWQEQFPSLRAKLYEFYTANNNIHAMLDKKGLERRRDQRFKLARKIQVQPINALDNPIGKGFRAETADISVGGLAFLIRISRQENARLLLGRRMQVVLPVAGPDPYLHLKGLVIAVQPFQILENDFSVHFKFDRAMEQEELQTILG